MEFPLPPISEICGFLDHDFDHDQIETNGSWSGQFWDPSRMNSCAQNSQWYSGQGDVHNGYSMPAHGPIIDHVIDLSDQSISQPEFPIQPPPYEYAVSNKATNSEMYYYATTTDSCWSQNSGIGSDSTSSATVKQQCQKRTPKSESAQKKQRRRIPTQSQRKAANIRERRRMLNLNGAFESLRKTVPTFAYEKNLSRIDTLRLAITYIRFMDGLLNTDKSQNS